MWYRAAQTIREIGEDRWDVVAGGEILMTHRWQRVLEASRRSYHPHYLLLEDLQGPRAAVVLSTSDAFGRSGWQEALLRRLTVQISAPFCARHCGIALQPGTALADVLPTLERAFGTLYRRRGHVLLSASNVSERDLPVWRAQGYLALRQRSTTILDVPTASYEQYLAGLQGRDRRELGRIKRRGAQQGVSFAHGPLAGDGDQLYPLVREVYARHRTPMVFTSELFAALEREMPGEVMVFRGYVQGRLAAMLLSLMHRPMLSVPVGGMRYDLAYPNHLYFLLTDEMVRWSIAHGFQRIYGGITNEQQKGRHGFRTQARWFCFRASPRPLHRALTAAVPRAQCLVALRPSPASAGATASGTSAHATCAGI
jgi:predicted N-acyltransferase